MAASSGSRPTQLDSAYSPPDFDSYPVSQGTAGVLLAFASALLWALSNTVSRRVARYGAGGVVVPHGEALFSPKEPTWWASSCCAIAAEVVQFSAFALSPVTLIAPIASSSSIVFTVLSAHHFTNEALNMFGVLGCMLWAAGCLPLVLTVPEEEEFTSIAQIWSHALQPGFAMYLGSILLMLAFLMCVAVPVNEPGSPLAPAAVSGAIGSVSVMAAKVLAIAVRLTLEGNNQFVQPVACVLPLICLACFMVQRSYNHRAMGMFKTGLVTPVNFAVFNIVSVCGYLVLFQVPLNVVEIGTEVCSFVTICSGVFLIFSTKGMDTSSVSGLLRVGPKANREDLGVPQLERLPSTSRDGAIAEKIRKQQSSRVPVFN
mmetsp:Transcript_41160/g.74027  ORF Transcript_41160/g.74027 Transcript_41160/m.74027 type:complete len:373 (-) Transcript_41160:550-1668(-)|eukprot:CAMPEP_0177762756 /NCGR_PEP_ID=MMETSP0491_2-20121128/6512_1 /TAXON_ID=63592 /ORGANISM="Tetraselmis chuii, Strain PLY429" /LENGTH=372 /DNA_ID=CAMNT_0019278827 /DNA_START=91 /DNA_END=1209 /DNA_ORIENTATION=+